MYTRILLSTFLAASLAGVAHAGKWKYDDGAKSEKIESKSASSLKPRVATKLAQRWGKRYGLSADEIEEQANAITESIFRTRGMNHEGFEVPDSYDFKFKTLGVPSGSKRTAVILRSNQPAPENLVELAEATKKLGIKPSEVMIINLRAENTVEGTYLRDFGKSDKSDQKAVSQFQSMSLKILDHTIPSMSQVMQVLRAASDKGTKVVLIHCKAGRARTGIMVAAMRIALDGWSVDAALAEAEDKGLRRPLQKAFVKQFAADWKAGKISLDGNVTEKG